MEDLMRRLMGVLSIPLLLGAAAWLEPTPAASAVGSSDLQEAPSPRSGHALAYDQRHQRLVLYGGIDAQQQRLGDTWVWNGKWQRLAAAGPGPRLDAQMVCGTTRGRVVLFGGMGETERQGDRWECDGEEGGQAVTCGGAGRSRRRMTY